MLVVKLSNRFRAIVYAEGGITVERLVDGIGWVAADGDDDAPSDQAVASEILRQVGFLTLAADKLMA